MRQMGVLVGMCSYATEENGKLKYLKQTIESYFDTVDTKKHRLIIINNSQYEPSLTYLQGLQDTFKPSVVSVYHQKENLGTARGINLAMKERKTKQFFVKCDDDWITSHRDWIEEMQAEIKKNPDIGILGLRRDDVYGELIEKGNLLFNHDIMGTCTMYNPRLIETIGGLHTFSEHYGYDDTQYSVRSESAGFKNAFMKNIKITNLDEGGTEYTEWKKEEAGRYLVEASVYMDKIRKGELSYYYPID